MNKNVFKVWKTTFSVKLIVYEAGSKAEPIKVYFAKIRITVSTPVLHVLYQFVNILQGSLTPTALIHRVRKFLFNRANFFESDWGIDPSSLKIINIGLNIENMAIRGGRFSFFF